MKYGMTNLQFELLHTHVLQPLKTLGCQVFIFGSRISDSYHSHSDVDLLYRSIGNKPISGHILSDIREAIEESRFPFTVDLVAEEDLAEGYKLNVLNTMQRV